jgi:hypothetical protein
MKKESGFLNFQPQLMSMFRGNSIEAMDPQSLEYAEKGKFWLFSIVPWILENLTCTVWKKDIFIRLSVSA